MAANANRFPHGVGKLVWRSANNLSKDFVGISTVVADSLSSLGHIIIARNGIRLSIVACFDSRKGLAVVLDELRQTVHQLTALNTRKIPPAWVVQCGACGLDGGINILLRRSMNRGDFRSGAIKRENISTLVVV